ncbi:MAG: 5-formyltetrahydrofolate cyclo-ligase, partial [Candidatus Peribacteraceae bacterium]
DCALIPGRAFDRDGNRLGRGNGSYDHWIREQRTANPQTKIWGIAFECQIVPIVPTEEHDERVDALITARGLIHVKPT